MTEFGAVRDDPRSGAHPGGGSPSEHADLKEQLDDTLKLLGEYARRAGMAEGTLEAIGWYGGVDGLLAAHQEEAQRLRAENKRLRGYIAQADGKDAASFDWSVLGEIDRLETENEVLKGLVSGLEDDKRVLKNRLFEYAFRLEGGE